VEFGYRYPILQSYEGETSYPADLMVRLPNRRSVLAASEMRTIIRCIYFKHYLRWDRPFLDSDLFQKREQLINGLYLDQVSQIGGNDTFGTHGDNRPSLRDRRPSQQPRIGPLLDKIFGPKLPRLAVVIGLMLTSQWCLGNGWLLVPFALVVAAVYCLAEDSPNSRKLFVAIIAHLSHVRPG